MKKLLSIFFAALMIMSCIIIIPTSAEPAQQSVTSEEDNVLYDVDFKSKYKVPTDLGVTKDDTHKLGVTLIDRKWSNGADYKVGHINALTANGLVCASPIRYQSGVAITQDNYDLKSLSNYTIKVTAIMDVSSGYVWSGFGYEPDAQTNESNSNFRLYSNEGKNYFHFNGTASNPATRDAVWTALEANNRDGIASTFEYLVSGNVLQSVTVTSGTATATFPLKADYQKSGTYGDASNGGFYIYSSSTNGTTSALIQISKLEVIPTTAGDTYSIDFVSEYDTAMGSTDLGVTPIGYYWGTSSNNDWKMPMISANTANGYDSRTAYRYHSGIALMQNDIDLTMYTNYTISLKMQSYLNVASGNDKIYFGWNIPSTFSGSLWGANGEYYFVLDTNTKELKLNNFTAVSGDTKAIADKMAVQSNGNAGIANIDFVVFNNQCTRVQVECDGVRVVYTANSPVNASNGRFGIYGRAGSSTANPGMLISSLKVVNNNVRIVGHQKMMQSNNNFYNLRFISVVNDISTYDTMGYEVKAVVDGNTSAPKTFTNTSKYVYNSINGYVDGESVAYQPSKYYGTYFYCDTLFDVPAGTDVEITVTPFAIDTEGTKISFTSYTFKTEHNVKVATYNIKAGKLTGGTAAWNNLETGADPYNYTLIANDIKATGAEVIGLQEVHVGTAENPGNPVKDIADALGYKYYHYEKARDVDGGGSFGNAIVSKYPITETERIALTFNASDDNYYEPRILLRAKLNIEGTLVDFFVTHIETKPQTQHITDINNVVKNYSTFILLGDFNSHQWTGIWDGIFDTTKINYVNYTGRFVSTTFGTSEDQEFSGNAFDNIIHTKNIEGGTVKGSRYTAGRNSDHFVFYTTLKIDY